MKELVLLFSIFFTLTACASNSATVFYPGQGQVSSLKHMYSQAPSQGHIVLGEFHYDEKIQNMEAKIIEELTRHHRREGQVSVGWEFLNRSEQDQIEIFYQKFSVNEIDAQTFMKRFFKKDHSPYIPVLAASKKVNAEFLGTNVSREYKQLLIKEGIQALPEEIVPPNMSVGGPLYLERFTEAMGEHVPPHMVDKYFEAQCLADSSMSYSMGQSPRDLKFLVAGSFHTDYFQGTVSRLRRLGSEPVYLVKIVNKNKLKEEELEKIKEVHPKYGPVADAVVIVE